jgi:flagellar motor switch protein FliM
MSHRESKELLSNEEIDTLLELFRGEGAELELPDVEGLEAVTAAGQQRALVSPLDLLKPNRLHRHELTGFERYFQNAAIALSSAITERLRLELKCDCVAVEQLRFNTWTSQFERPAGIYVLKMPPFELPGLFLVTSELLYGAVDRILGGSGRIQQVPKSFTHAEYMVADALIAPCLDRITRSLAEIVELDWEIEARTSNLSMAQVLSPYEVVLSVYFQVSGDFLLGDMRLIMPISELEPYLGALSRNADRCFSHPAGLLRAAVERNLRDVPLELKVVLGEAEITLRELLQLSVDDVVRLNSRRGRELVAPVQGVPKFAGHVGWEGGYATYRIERILTETDS